MKIKLGVVLLACFILNACKVEEGDTVVQPAKKETTVIDKTKDGK